MSNATFANLVESGSNREARRAAFDVACSADSSYHPLVLFGPCGCGKTHLLKAVGSHILSAATGSRIRYLDPQLLIEETEFAVRNGKMDRLKRQYSALDALLIHNVQFLANRPQVHDVLLGAIEGGTRMVMNCDRYPQELALPDGLYSRLSFVEVGAPEPAIAFAVIQRLAAQAGFRLPVGIGLLIADLIGSDMREVEGAMNCLIAEAQLRGCVIDEKLVRRCLRRHFDAA